MFRRVLRRWWISWPEYNLNVPFHQSVALWIPKAKLGPNANHFRPLGMPSTFERLVDCPAAAVLARHVAPHLHPSQTVLNEFREPQQAVMAIQNVLDGCDPALVLSLDLSKAFERMNPFWLLKILRIRGAPTWVVRYAQHILFGRSIRHKVRSRLLPPRFVKNWGRYGSCVLGIFVLYRNGPRTDGAYMEIYGFTLCAVTMWLDRKLHDAFYDLEFISDDQQMLSVLFSPSMTYG